jgi:glycine cleavage system H protein
MQYCAAAPVAKMVPYSESLLSRCGNDGFRYCELYLSMAHPGAKAGDVDGIAMPDWLRYSANHMWLDLTEDGTCHAGIDAFLSRALGKVDRIAYVWLNGQHRPAAVLTAGGADYEVIFPNSLVITKCNLYLRADPARLTAEPYGAGWLFEGTPQDDTTRDLLQGEGARRWMESEQRRINEFLQAGSCTAADGGTFAAGLPHALSTCRMRALFHEFFSPYAGKRES